MLELSKKIGPTCSKTAEIWEILWKLAQSYVFNVFLIHYSKPCKSGIKKYCQGLHRLYHLLHVCAFLPECLNINLQLSVWLIFKSFQRMFWQKKSFERFLLTEKQPKFRLLKQKLSTETKSPLLLFSPGL